MAESALGRASHVIELRVRYAETDAMGVVYYANYLVYFELGRTEWVRAHGVPYREFEDEGVLLPVVDVSCRYHASARYDDLLRIETTATMITPARITFHYRVTRPATAGTLLADGYTAHVFLTRDGRLTRLNRHPRLWTGLAPVVSALAARPPDR